MKSYHSICVWTFNAGKGGFTPSDIRPAWSAANLDTIGVVGLIRDQIRPRLPDSIELGLEAHYDYEYDETNAAALADALVDAKMALAMGTPGAHRHFAYGGICSLDDKEREEAAAYGTRALELLYGPFKKAFKKNVPPTFVLWNGSFGYDLCTVGVREMYARLKESIADLVTREKKLGGELYLAVEPKPNEGHPAMLLPTVASAIVFWKKLEQEFGTDISRAGVNKEFGHSEMIGLDLVYDTVEEIDNGMLVHMHVNSQGYNDGILAGGPGKYDIDNGTRVNGMNIAVAGLIARAGYNRWKGHDMQPRAYDNEAQAVDRVVRSILSWEACEQAAAKLDEAELLRLLSARKTAAAEDLMRGAVVDAQKIFDRLYKG
ncbi:MAG TPA: xylose isomerase [Spirochaetia bacterium]|nr:xylose isomerase [Spirochaetia bacterium]